MARDQGPDVVLNPQQMNILIPTVSPESVEALVFDLGGVLLDVQLQRTLRAFEALDIRGLGAAEVIDGNRACFRDLELGLITQEEFAEAVRRTFPAVAAIPGTGSFAFCSSGTWSLFGVETDKPILTDAVRDANFSNEGTIQGGFRPLSNIMGLWLIQECRRDWQKAGQKLSWSDIVEEAKRAEPFRTIIDTDDSTFYAGGQMPEKIRSFARRTGQPVPETVGQIARCIYESLALKYRWALERLEGIKGARIDTLNIVGGGCNNKLLNQFAADATGRPVITGPVEGAAIGNLLAQAMALGDIRDVDELRAVVRRSEAVNTYEPHHTPEWEAAYQKLLSFGK